MSCFCKQLDYEQIPRQEAGVS